MTVCSSSSPTTISTMGEVRNLADVSEGFPIGDGQTISRSRAMMAQERRSCQCRKGKRTRGIKGQHSSLAAQEFRAQVRVEAQRQCRPAHRAVNCLRRRSAQTVLAYRPSPPLQNCLRPLIDSHLGTDWNWNSPAQAIAPAACP